MNGLRICVDPWAVGSAAAEEFYRRALLARGRGRNFACALSGGSTARFLFETMSDVVHTAKLPLHFWDAVHLFWGDERVVPPDDVASNYGLARELLLNRIPIPESNIHHIPAELGAAKAATEYEAELKSYFATSGGEFPRFDLVFLGMGVDGHIASIFPDSEFKLERSRSVSGIWVPKLDSFRITITLPVINNAACVIFLVAGKSKSGALHRVLSGAFEPRSLPAQMVNPKAGDKIWLVDRDAASELSDQPS